MPANVVVAPVSLVPVTVTVAAFSVALIKSSVATVLIVGAVGAVVSILNVRVVLLLLPAASVDSAVTVCAPSPKLVIAAALSV